METEKKLNSVQNLHDDHSKWLSFTDYAKEELETLEKFSPQNLKKEIEDLKRNLSILDKNIHRHEQSLSQMLQVEMEIESPSYTDHSMEQKLYNNAKFKFENLRSLISHHLPKN